MLTQLVVRGLSIRNLALITSRLSSWCSSGGNEVIDNEVFIIFEPTPTTPSRLPPTPLTTSFIISTLCFTSNDMAAKSVSWLLIGLEADVDIDGSDISVSFLTIPAKELTKCSIIFG
ncbi:hypothetical protein GQX74_002940 [Glossina fuscipes]|nr:hypothetical protein GQX74_002940 [Glossina fuscipes]